jgi:hypothetical protein
MIELLPAVLAVIPSTIGAFALLIRARAAHKRAEAELLWASRCDPSNRNFRQPLIARNSE